MKLVLALAATIALVEAGSSDYQIDAKFKGNCDNKGSVYRMDALAEEKTANDEWEWLGDFGSWEQTLKLQIPDVQPNTRLKVVCKDQGVVGGFIGQVTIQGVRYYTKGNLQGTPWRVWKISDEDLVSTHNGEGPWKSKLPNGVETIDNNADWVWNSETNNQLIFVFNFKHIVFEAVFKGNCDNVGSLSISNDGETWIECVAKEDWNNWQNTKKKMFHAVTRQTTLKVECKDKSPDNVGGFIGQVAVRGRKYETKKSGSKWEVTKGTNDDIVYTDNGKAPWGDAADSLVDTAQWMWDGKTENKLTFEFKFDRVLPDYSLAPGWNVDDWFDMPSEDDPQGPQQPPQKKPIVNQPLTNTKEVPVVDGTMYYLMMLACALLIANVVCAVAVRSKSLFSFCKGRSLKYSKVDLYPESDVEKDRLNAVNVE